MACSRILAVGLALLSLASAQSSTISASPTTTGSSDACATVSSLLASYSSAQPTPTANFQIPASLAYDCALSAPIIQQDALRLIDGLSAFLEWQSDLAYLKNPPAGYQFPAVDLLGSLQKIRTNVQNNSYSSEFVFEQAITNLITSARDGHLTYRLDCLNVLRWVPKTGSFVSVSLDGVSLPQIFSLSDIVSYVSSPADTIISPVVAINGADATDYLQALSLYSAGFQDLDTLWNTLFYEASNADSGNFFAAFPAGYYPGEWLNLTFANGNTANTNNVAYTTHDFTGVTDGGSFYNAFCNATAKIEAVLNAQGGGGSKKRQAATSTASQAATSTSGTPDQPTTSVAYPRSAYPSPAVVNSDGSFAGYFFPNGTDLEDVAVISLLGFTETVVLDAQAAFANFIDLCRTTNKQYLIFDVSGNGGGEIILGYDFFKQLFPHIDPFAAANLRAHPAYDIVGAAGTELADQDRNHVPFNASQFLSDGGDQAFDGQGFVNQYNVQFQSWEDYYGPETRHGDNFTRLARFPYWNPVFDEAYSVEGFVVSNSNGSDLPSRPFDPKNMVILTDGQCSSTCTTFTHLMKWQGKVPSILAGGRPQYGPAQAVGGIKGKNVYPITAFAGILTQFYTYANESLQEQANQTTLKTLADNLDYLVYRLYDPSQGDLLSLNFMSSIAEGDETFTPLQFVYEAADCKLWLTPQTVMGVSSQWTQVAEQAFGINTVTKYSGCALGSTTGLGSLLNNPTLYNDGNPTNVTDFATEPGVNKTSSSASKVAESKHYRYMKAGKP